MPNVALLLLLSPSSLMDRLRQTTDTQTDSLKRTWAQSAFGRNERTAGKDLFLAIFFLPFRFLGKVRRCGVEFFFLGFSSLLPKSWWRGK